MNLVEVKNHDCFTNSLAIAEGTGILHNKLKRAIRKNQEHIEQFGKLSVPCGIESSGGRPTEVYLLNEQQATFLITLLKNTDVVIAFKIRLVQEFYRMILERGVQITNSNELLKMELEYMLYILAGGVILIGFQLLKMEK